jgi:hypothetical protein
VKAVILRRGLDESYYFYMKITAKANGMAVIVDRRRRERRLGVAQTDLERRALDRRAPPPGSWVKEGFIFTASHE